MSEQIVAKPSGVITEPNKVGQYPPGAFSSCQNVAIRSFGTAELVGKWRSWDADALGGNLVGGAYAVSDGPYSAFLVEVGGVGIWKLVVYKATDAGATTKLTATLGSPWNTYITNDGRTGVVMSRNRIIVAGTVRSFVFDLVENPSTGVTTLHGPRNCGVYQSVLYNRTSSLGVTADDPAYLGPNQHFSATSVLRVKFIDGYELLSPPAIPYDYANLSTTLPQVRSEWTTKADTTVGSPIAENKIDIYRTRAQSVGYDSINNKYVPVSTGSSFYLSKTLNWVVNFATFYNVSPDTTLPSTLGEALLTNVSVGGASALPLPPVPAKTCAVFRGHTFYANRFDPATLELLNPYYWGLMNLATASSWVLQQGIGTRFTTSGQASVSGDPTVTGLPNTLGIVSGQTFNVYRSDTGVLVTSNNNVLSKTATTVTGTTNVTYTGAVRVEFLDRIELNGVNVSASASPQDFVSQLFFGNLQNLNTQLDIAAVGLEPITTENPVGVYPNFVPTGGMTIRMRTNAPITIRATNGQNFSPKLPEIASTVLTIPGTLQKNGFSWSENNEPENCPPSNYAFAGQGEIYKILATRDALWFFCSDGLFRLSGSGGSVGEEYDWVLDPADPTLVIANPDSACASGEYAYAHTNKGVVSVSSEGVVRQLSDGRIAPSGATELRLENKSWTTSWLSANGVNDAWGWVAADVANDEILVRDRSITGVGNYAKIWAYSSKTDTWTIRLPSLFSQEIPNVATYNTKLDMLFSMFSGRPNVASSRGTAGEYEAATIDFQPLYGAGHGAQYSQKHWQDVSLSFRSPQAETNVGITLSSQSVVAGTRTLPAATVAANGMEMARVGFTIPRAFPAVSNALTLKLFINPPVPVASLETIKFEGISISYIDFSPQRVRR